MAHSVRDLARNSSCADVQRVAGNLVGLHCTYWKLPHADRLRWSLLSADSEVEGHLSQAANESGAEEPVRRVEAGRELHLFSLFGLSFSQYRHRLSQLICPMRALAQ